MALLCYSVNKRNKYKQASMLVIGFSLHPPSLKGTRVAGQDQDTFALSCGGSEESEHREGWAVRAPSTRVCRQSSPSFGKVMTESALNVQCGGCEHPAIGNSVVPCTGQDD